MKITTLPLCVCAVAAFSACNLSAAAISGSFSMSGLITVTNSSITFASDATGNAANLFTTTLSTGGYTGENGQNQVENLVLASEPVGATFQATDFINFLVNSALPDLDITYIDPGIYTNAGCSAAVANGDTCTPNVGGGAGLFSFVDNPPGGSQSTATFVFQGIEAGYPNSSFTAIFTSQFNEPYQSVLANIASPSFSVTNSYSATVTVVSSTPEPGPGLMLASGLGLILLSLAGRRKLGKQVQ